MGDWHAYVRRRLAASPAVIAELAQQLEQVYEAELAAGRSEPEARGRAEAHVSDWTELARSIAAAQAPIVSRLPLPVRAAMAAMGFGRDLRHTARGLLRARGFALTAIATLGLGIGLCLATFTLADALVLRPLPFPRPDRILALLETSRQFPQMGVSWPDFQDWQTANRSFSELAATRGTVQVLAHLGTATTVPGLRVTANYFTLLGAHAALGRTLLPSDEAVGAADVVVVSAGFFQNRLNGNRSWLGRTLDMDGHARTLVGVMPADFPGIPGSDAEFWTPLGRFVASNEMNERGNHAGILVLGRLRDGVTRAQARANFDAVTRALARQYPATNAGVSAAMQPYHDLLFGRLKPTLLLLLAASGLVLMIACFNVATLLLARGAQRQRDQAIRAALGASRGRLLAGACAECLGLSLGGCAVGLFLAAAVLRIVGSLSPALGLPIADLSLDPRALVFACAMTLASAMACGLVPAFAARSGPNPASLRYGAAVPRRGRLGTALIAAEMSGSVVLLIAAALLLHSLVRLQNRNYGFEQQGTLSFIVGLTASYSTTQERLLFFRKAEQNLARIPGVAAAGGVQPLPLVGYVAESPFLMVGRPQPAPGQEPTADIVFTRGDYFHAMEIPLLRGRVFHDSDGTHAPAVAMVDDVLVRRYFRQAHSLEDVLGQQIILNGTTRAIVGVVAHVQDSGLAGAPKAEIYVPQEQGGPMGAMSFVLRATNGDADHLRRPALAAIAALDPNLAATDVQTMSERVADDMAPRRATAGLLGACAALALLLACLGIYGVISFAVAQRTREIGVRMALGASRGRVLGSVLTQGVGTAAIGAFGGILLATQATRALGTLLFGVTTLDPLAYILAPAILLVAAALACLVPARRATRVDPLIALRTE